MLQGLDAGGGGDETEGNETESDEVLQGFDAGNTVNASPIEQGGESTGGGDVEDARSYTTDVSYDYDFGSASEEEEDAPPCCSNAGRSSKKRPRDSSTSSRRASSCNGSDVDDKDDNSNGNLREKAIRDFNSRWKSQPSDEWYEREMQADAARAYGREQ